jgi:hypothetical protein
MTRVANLMRSRDHNVVNPFQSGLVRNAGNGVNPLYYERTGHVDLLEWIFFGYFP